MKRMELHATFVEKSGKPVLEYSDRFYLDKIESFKQANVGQEVRIVFENIDNITEEL
jgi:hypothetical protein